jgi:hypothetical protein
VEAKEKTAGHGSHIICYRHKLKSVALRNNYGNLSFAIVPMTFKILGTVGYKCDVEDIRGVGEG